jgi:peptide/nickel transport system permease protein
VVSAVRRRQGWWRRGSGGSDSASATLVRLKYEFRRSPLAVLSLILIVVMLVLAVGAPLFGRYDPTAGAIADFEQPPSWAHWLGTDTGSRDIWSRLIWGARNSLFVGVGAVAVATLIGVAVGALSGYYRGIVDSTLMRITDGFLAFPGIVLMLMLASVLGPSIVNVVLVIAFFGWMGVARLVRAEFLSLREQDWTLAARAIGVRDGRLIRKHLLPHVLPTVLISMTFNISGAIIAEASLSYLGLGVRPPAPSWGAMLSEARNVHVFRSLPWVWLPPGLTLLFVVLAVNYLGEALRRALDPYSLR